MSIMRLPVRMSTTRRAEPLAGSPWKADDRSGGAARPGDELLDLYSVIAIAIPLALLLRWLWP